MATAETDDLFKQLEHARKRRPPTETEREDDRTPSALSNPRRIDSELVRKLSYIQEQVESPARDAADKQFLLGIRRDLLRRAKR